MTYYSQHGEDKVIEALFPGKTDGFFIEVGALDGKRFSNTLSFEERGWTGILVEPHPLYTALLRKNRPNSTVLPICVSDKDELVTLYSNARGSLSTLDPAMEATFKKAYAPWFHGFVPIQVPSRRLTTILDFLGAPSRPDILSIDTEGCDHLVLYGLDAEKYTPRVIIAEYMNNESRKHTESIMAKRGYRLARELSNNLLFCYNAEDEKIIREADGTCELVHTENTVIGEVSK